MNRNIKRSLNKLNKLPWGVIFANLLTLLALWYSIYNNNENDRDSKLELRRVHSRDSIQGLRDSVRTQILIKQLHDQIVENRRNRNRDSSQLSLFSSQISLLNKSLQSQNEGIKVQNEGIKVQNEVLETERLDKQSQLILKTGFKVDNYNEGYVSPNLSYSLTNVGNSIAQNIISNYCIISIDNTDNQSVKCINSIEASFDNVTIKPNESIVLVPALSMGFPLIKKGNYREIMRKKREEMIQRHFSEIDKVRMLNQPKELDKLYKKQEIEKISFYKKYPEESITNYVIIKISYTDKYRKVPNEVYAILEIDFRLDSDEKQGHVRAVKARYSSFPKLIKCIKENDFSEKQIEEQLKKSTAKNENSFGNF